MKILFCTTTFSSTSHGPAKFANLLVEINQIYENVELHILTEDVSESTSLIHRLSLNVPFYARYVSVVYRNIPYFKKIQELDEEIGFDIIWFNNVIYGMLAAKRITKIPIIGMINDYCSIAPTIREYGVKQLWWRYRIFHIIEKGSKKYFNRVVANSYYLRELIIQHYRFPIERVEMLWKSVDVDNPTFATASLITNSPIKVLFVKTNYILGGFTDLVNALQLLSYKFELTVVGPKPQDIYETFTLHQSSNKNITIVPKGKLSQIELFKLFPDQHIFCTPSRKEALGVANMEALIHKLPVVYTNIGGVPEVMNYGENGFAADAGDSISLSYAIRACIENSEDRIRKVEQGFNFVKTKFAKQSMFKNFVKLSKNVISTHHKNK